MEKPNDQQTALFLPVLDCAEEALQGLPDDVAGAPILRKKFSIAVHFQRIGPAVADGVP
jgi:hypothetical protein